MPCQAAAWPEGTPHPFLLVPLQCSDHNCVSCPRATDHCLACQNGRYADRKTGKCVACAVFNCDACNSANAASCDECTLGYNRVPMPSGDFKCLKQLPAGRASFPN